jgi:hypothetical protein
MIQKTHCVECGQLFFDDPQFIPRPPCPKCGGLARGYTIEAGTGEYMLMGSDVIVSVARSIKYYADYQREWEFLLPVLNRDDYRFESRSLAGDAPKDFVIIQGNGLSKIHGDSSRPSYIAKIGSKNYPNESFTEHLNGLVGHSLGLRVANSSLCIIEGKVRFLSNYFLGPDEELIHGVQMLEAILGEDVVRSVAEGHLERDSYSFQMLDKAIREYFPANATELLSEFVRMLAYDALIGLHDRHHANWGIVRSVTKEGVPRFAPLFDNARALFWNWSEERLQKMSTDEAMLKGYVLGSLPVMGWEGRSSSPNHVELLGLVAIQNPEYRESILMVLNQFNHATIKNLLEHEFADLLSPLRRDSILLCLRMRHEYLIKNV